MLQQTLQKILNNYKIYTAAQFGLDTEFSSLLIDYFDSVSFYDRDSEYSWKVKEDLDCKNCGVLFSDSIQHDLAYLDFDYDFVYIHNRFEAQDDLFLIRHFQSKKAKFILTHPKVSTINTGGEYGTLSLGVEDGFYTLYYRKLILD